MPINYEINAYLKILFTSNQHPIKRLLMFKNLKFVTKWKSIKYSGNTAVRPLKVVELGGRAASRVISICVDQYSEYIPIYKQD